MNAGKSDYSGLIGTMSEAFGSFSLGDSLMTSITPEEIEEFEEAMESELQSSISA